MKSDAEYVREIREALITGRLTVHDDIYDTILGQQSAAEVIYTQILANRLQQEQTAKQA